MRITGGKAKGIQLSVSTKADIRPATDGLREAVFSSIGQSIINASVLDLFAGSGAYGLEALSRGAAQCAFVEMNKHAAKLLQANIDKVNKSMQATDADTTTINCCDFFRWPLPRTGNNNLSFVFVDPPYSLWSTDTQKIFDKLEALAELNPQAKFMVECPYPKDMPNDKLKLEKIIGKKIAVMSSAAVS